MQEAKNLNGLKYKCLCDF